MLFFFWETPGDLDLRNKTRAFRRSASGTKGVQSMLAMLVELCSLALMSSRIYSHETGVLFYLITRESCLPSHGTLLALSYP